MTDKLVIPTDADGLKNMLGDAAKVQRLMAEGQFANAIDAYAKATQAKDSDLKVQIKEQMQAAMADMLRENGQEGRVPQTTKVSNRGGALHSKSAPGSSLDSEYSGLSDYFQTIWHNAYQTDEVRNRLRTLRNAASTTDPAGGGFLVPEALRSSLQAISLENSVVRPRARVIPMETSRVSIPAVDETTHNGSVYGGIVGYWTEEGAAHTESNPTFAQVTLDAKKLTVYSLVNNELLTDSGASFEAFASRAFPEALAFFEDQAFLSGSGAGQPFGVYNAPAKIAVTRDTSSAIKYEDVVNMYARMLPSSLNRAVWVISPEAWPQLATMVQVVQNVAGDQNVGGSSAWIPDGSVAGSPPLTLLGRPVIISEKAPQLGAAGDIAFLDFSHYLVGDRMAMTATSSPHYKFQNDQTAFKIVTRVDGRPGILSALTPANGGDTLSPFVTLAA